MDPFYSKKFLKVKKIAGLNSNHGDLHFWKIGIWRTTFLTILASFCLHGFRKMDSQSKCVARNYVLLKNFYIMYLLRCARLRFRFFRSRFSIGGCIFGMISHRRIVMVIATGASIEFFFKMCNFFTIFVMLKFRMLKNFSKKCNFTFSRSIS